MTGVQTCALPIFPPSVFSLLLSSPFLSVSLVMAFLYPSSKLPVSLPFSSFFLPFPRPSLLDLSSPSFPSRPLSSSPRPLQMEKLLLPAVDLEQWYQELMAGLGTGPAEASPRSSPPPLPAKASRQLQVTPPPLPTPPSPGPAPLCSGDLLPMCQPRSAALGGGGVNAAGATGASGP